MKASAAFLTSLLRRGLEARRHDVVVLLQLVVKAVSPPQLPDQFGRLQTAAVLDLLDYRTQLLQI